MSFDALSDAIKANNFEEVKKLLDHANGELTLSVTKLTQALYDSINKIEDLEIAKLLLKCGAKPSVIIGYSESCMHKAARANRADLIGLFIENNANINVPEEFGEELPLDKAVFCKSTDATRILLSNNARVAKFHQGGYSNLLSIAVTNKFIPGIRLLLEHGADPNFKGNRRRSLFENSFAVQNDEVTELFLRHGADLNLKTGDQRNVLHLVVKNNSRRLVRQVLEMNKFDVNEKDKFNYTPVNLAVKYRKGDECLAIIRLLVSHGAEVNGRTVEKNQQCFTTLFYAIKQNRLDKVRCLVNLGADLERCGCGRPLLLATKSGYEEILKFLLNSGAKFQLEDTKNLDKIISAILEIDSNKQCIATVKIMMMNKLVLGDQKNVVSIAHPRYERYLKVKDIQSQLDRMKVTKVVDELDVTYYDILTKRGNALVRCLYQTPVLAKLLCVAGSITCIRELKLDDWFDLLRANYLRGIRLQEIQSILQEALEIHLPYELILMVVDNITDEDLDRSLQLRGY